MPKDTHSTLPTDADLVLPEQVTVALTELAGAREGLFALDPAASCVAADSPWPGNDIAPSVTLSACAVEGDHGEMFGAKASQDKSLAS
jgi:hypothetical protein